MTRKRRLYLAGPMTGIPRFNFPEFNRVAALLRDTGYRVIAPHEEDPDHVQAAAWASETGDINDLPMGGDPVETAVRNVRHVLACDGVALMDGWQRSSGTRHEIETANRAGIYVAPAELWFHASEEFIRVYAND